MISYLLPQTPMYSSSMQIPRAHHSWGLMRTAQQADQLHECAKHVHHRACLAGDLLAFIVGVGARVLHAWQRPGNTQTRPISSVKKVAMSSPTKLQENDYAIFEAHAAGCRSGESETYQKPPQTLQDACGQRLEKVPMAPSTIAPCSDPELN